VEGLIGETNDLINNILRGRVVLFRTAALARKYGDAAAEEVRGTRRNAAD
jgi:hypothetical protein